MRRVPGIGGARASQLSPRSRPAGARCRARAASAPQDSLAALDVGADCLVPQFGRCRSSIRLCCSTRSTGSRAPRLSVGTLDASIVHPREVFRAAASGGAAALVVFHNHPSGDPTPSEDDVALTRRLIRAGDLMGISLDHVIVAENRFSQPP